MKLLNFIALCVTIVQGTFWIYENRKQIKAAILKLEPIVFSKQVTFMIIILINAGIILSSILASIEFYLAVSNGHSIYLGLIIVALRVAAFLPLYIVAQRSVRPQ